MWTQTHRLGCLPQPLSSRAASRHQPVALLRLRRPPDNTMLPLDVPRLEWGWSLMDSLLSNVGYEYNSLHGRVVASSCSSSVRRSALAVRGVIASPVWPLSADFVTPRITPWVTAASARSPQRDRCSLLSSQVHIPHAPFPGRTESLVVDDEAAGAEEQDLHAITSAAEEAEERAAVRIGAPERPNEGDEPVVTATEIDGLCGEHDLNAGAETQHERAAVTSAARCSRPSAPRTTTRASSNSTTTGKRRGPAAGFSRARRTSSERHQTKVRAHTPWRRAIDSASSPRDNSSTRFTHQLATCLDMTTMNQDACDRARRRCPYGYVPPSLPVGAAFLTLLQETFPPAPGHETPSA